MKRCFDFCCAIVGLLILLPILVLIAILLLLSSPGPVFYTHLRVGRDERPFKLVKFRTMSVRSEAGRSLTIGDDHRITKVGKWLRAYKIDELPQLWNVVKGEMSLVGPRPEVPKYVNLYTQEQRKILSVRPGITDMASIKYANEAELLGQQVDPEAYYVEVIMPDKIAINLATLPQSQSVWGSIHIIFKTILRLIR